MPRVRTSRPGGQFGNGLAARDDGHGPPGLVGEGDPVVASPFGGTVGIVIGLYVAWAIRRGGGQLWGYLSAGPGVALELAQFAFLFRVDSEWEGFTITAAPNVTATYGEVTGKVVGR